MAIELQNPTDNSAAIAELERKRRARLSKRGYDKNVQAIDDEIARLRGE